MDKNCGVCKKELPNKAAELDCTRCSQCMVGYHFDCCNLKFSSWKSMGITRRSEWTCLKCRKKTDGGTEDEGKEVNEEQDNENLGGTPEPRKERDYSKKLNNEPDTIAKMIEEKFDNMQKFIEKTMEDFKKTLNFYGGQIEDLTTSMKSLEQKNLKIEKDLETQKAINTEMKTRIRNLEIAVEQKDQLGRNTEMEVTGFKNNVVDEKLFVRTLLEKAGTTEMQVKIKKSVKPPKNDKPGNTTIYVHFQSEDDRNTVLSTIKEKKLYTDMNATIQSTNPVNLFFNECLTPYYRRLFYEARRLKIEKKFAYVWVKNGKILLKKTSESQTQVLSSMDDIGRL